MLGTEGIGGIVIVVAVLVAVVACGLFASYNHRCGLCAPGCPCGGCCRGGAGAGAAVV